MSKLDYETVRARRAGLTRALDGILVNAADHGFTGTDFTNHRGTQTRHGRLEDARPVSLDALPPLRPPSCWAAWQAERLERRSWQRCRRS